MDIAGWSWAVGPVSRPDSAHTHRAMTQVNAGSTPLPKNDHQQAALPQWRLVALCAVLGFLLPATYGLSVGIQDPAIHDEYGYLLGADTFASGRLTNPSPDLPRFFES